jgi:hypothetical protein
VSNGPGNGAGGGAEDLPPDEYSERHGGDVGDANIDADIDADIDWEQRVADVSQEMDEEAAASGGSSRLDAWRRRSATGAILTGIARGLQGVFEKEKEDPAIVQETSGDPPTDLPVEADVQQGRARHSVVNIRPWLLGQPAGGNDPLRPSGGEGSGPTGPGGGADEDN